MPDYWVLLNHTVFILGGKLFFKSPAGLLSIKRFISFALVYLASAAGSVYVLLRHPSRSGLKRFLALVLAGSSSALFAQSVAATRQQPLTPINTTDQPQHLNRHGPYAYVRHPFYSSYILNFLAAAIGSDSPVGYLCLLVIAGVYMQAAKSEEAKFDNSNFATAYKEYKATTSMIVPWLLWPVDLF
jgi:protein-S-isoprenylcysteine O-methyltransferase Ste14